MRNSVKASLLLASMLVTSASLVPAARADRWERERRDDFRADRQEWRAQRDAARGNYWGAEEHAARAQRDEWRARHEGRRPYYYW